MDRKRLSILFIDGGVHGTGFKWPVDEKGELLSVGETIGYLQSLQRMRVGTTSPIAVELFEAIP